MQIAEAEAEAARRGIGLALLYDGGGTVEPPAWRPVARLAARRIGAGDTNYGVTLYAVTEADVPRIQAALRDFAPTVPPSPCWRCGPDGGGGSAAASAGGCASRP